ncbi:hypothetical protein C8J35_11618 [Rhizobium sp. PP-F2F-G38]|nr:hypothetical protein C8J35_11618 [Rhizobium sp. PP-F2F-G38]
MEFVDPATGNYSYLPALNFMSEFEREAAYLVNNDMDSLDLGWQIIYL